MKPRLIFSVFLLLILNSCSIIDPSGSLKTSPTPLLVLPTSTPDVPALATSVLTLTPTLAAITPTQVEPAQSPQKLQPTQISATLPWHKQGPGEVVCPILLYHRIDISKDKNPYFTSPSEFRAEMQALKDWGYTAIPISLLVEALNNGAKLPARPIVLTFDDGDISVYTTAFPILRDLGFTGVAYVVGNYVGADGYMDAEQLKEMVAAGWELGSHSMSHKDLTTLSDLDREVVESKDKLKRLIGAPIATFAYPFGKENRDIRAFVSKHYMAGMGLGVYLTQRKDGIFYLSRRPVDPGWDLKTFSSYLPWGPLE